MQNLLHPREQIIEIMSRIYSGGMTTTSGGNISIREETGDLWITPASVDKGVLAPRDIVCIRSDGSVEGVHKPSSEFPIHRAIYRNRPDLNAIIHAHPPALVSFSIVRQVPDTSVIPQAQHVCGPVGYAPYKLPGSEALGESIADQFSEKYNAVIMENHGTVVGGSTLQRAFQRFETLEFCARTIIKAREIGRVHRLSETQIQQFEHRDNLLTELDIVKYPSEERAIRSEIRKYVRRACVQGLMISTYGTVSVRWGEDGFIITPTGIDRRNLQVEDLVQISAGKREPGKLPSRSVRLHQQIYEAHSHIKCIILTQSPNAMAFSISGQAFNSRTIPESYIMLKDIPLVSYGSQFGKSAIPNVLSKETPIVLIQNDSILVTGKSLLETFDRLEVAEFSARSLIDSKHLGEIVPIEDKEIEDLRRKFLSEG